MTVLLALAGAAASGIGAALMKSGIATRFPRISLSGFLREWRRVAATVLSSPGWLLGLLLGVSGGFLLAQAMSGGDLSVVQILANTASLWSVAIGVLFFSEKLTRGEWFGLGLTLFGAVLVSLSHEATGSGRPRLAVLAVVVVVTAAVMILTHLVQRRSRSGLGSEFLLAADAGLGFGLINVFMKLTTWDAAERLGSFHVLGSASWAHMLTHPPFWFMVAAIFPAFLFLQAAFAHGRVAVVMPLHIVFINILTIVCAVLVYRESLDLLRSAGILAAIAGAAVLAVQSGTGQDRPGRNLSSRKANGDKNS